MAIRIKTEEDGDSFFLNFNTTAPADGVLTCDDRRQTLQGPMSATVMTGSYLYGDQLQLKIYAPKGELKTDERARSGSKWDRLELIVSLEDGRELIEALYRYFQSRTRDTMTEIDWDKFQSRFYRIEPGTQAKIVLKNWRQEERTFQDSKTPRTALVFDVDRDEKQTFIPPKEWSTTSPTLAEEFKPLIEKAEANGRDELIVILKRTTDKRYIVIDISEDRAVVRKYEGLKA